MASLDAKAPRQSGAKPLWRLSPERSPHPRQLAKVGSFDTHMARVKPSLEVAHPQLSHSAPFFDESSGSRHSLHRHRLDLLSSLAGEALAPPALDYDATSYADKMLESSRNYLSESEALSPKPTGVPPPPEWRDRACKSRPKAHRRQRSTDLERRSLDLERSLEIDLDLSDASLDEGFELRDHLV